MQQKSNEGLVSFPVGFFVEANMTVDVCTVS